MPVISDSAIAAAAKGAGLNDSQTAIAVAIALAESGGNTTAHNMVPPDNSYGLWQINMLGSLGPSRRQQFGLLSNDELYSPTVNAKAMFSISNGGQNWRDWTSYTRGTYLVFMSRGRAVAGTSGDSQTGPTTTPVGLSDSLSAITALFTALRDPGFWKRIALLTAGASILLFGLFKVTGDNQISQGTKSLAKAGIGLLPGGGTVMQGAKTVAKVVKS